MAGKLLIGKPGAGKSYTAVADEILPALKQGRVVITNLPLQLDVLRQFVPNADDLVYLRQTWGPEFFGTWDIKNEKWIDQDPFLSWQHPKIRGMGPLILVDEAHEHFALKTTDKSVLFWFAKHRHQGCDFVLITQRTKKLHIDVRDLCEFTVVVQRTSVVKIIRPALMFKDTYVRLIYDGADIGWTSRPMHKQVRFYDPKVYKLYQSFTMGGGEFKRKRPAGFQALKWPVLLVAGALIWGLLAGDPPPEAPAPVDEPAIIPAKTQPAALPVPAAPPVPLVTPHQEEVQAIQEKIELAVYENALARTENGDTLPPVIPRLGVAEAGPLAGWRLWVTSSMEVWGELSGEVCGLRQGMRACWTVHELRATGYEIAATHGGDMLVSWGGVQQHVAFRASPPREPVGRQYGAPGVGALRSCAGHGAGWRGQAVLKECGVMGVDSLTPWERRMNDVEASECGAACSLLRPRKLWDAGRTERRARLRR
ncbi:MAG: hypothetical protein E8G75_01000 [Sulfitobacter sp. SK025]|nr:MAG: hypothetical protein E8G75_01000 [Sulfitobacter sp. SK025]